MQRRTLMRKRATRGSVDRISNSLGIKELARPERFELPTFWFVASRPGFARARPTTPDIDLIGFFSRQLRSNAPLSDEV
jgi:hypothetical protein